MAESETINAVRPEIAAETETANEKQAAAENGEPGGAAVNEAAEAGEAEPEICFDAREIDRMTAMLIEKDALMQAQSDRIKRLQADFDNFRKRTLKEKEELSALITQDLIKELLPLLDNFERAVAAPLTQDAAAVKAGVEMIYRQFMTVLQKNGLASIETDGAQFDPQFHEAIQRVADDTKEDGAIVQELQKGYMVRGRVIRPSMVQVAGN